MGMMDVLRKRWRYFTAKTDSRFEANADPKVQLEQAIADAQDQHRRLVEQAANVVANQKQHELQLNRAMEELEKVHGSTKAREYNQTAEAFANRLIATENQVNDLKTLSLQSAQAADQARAAVQQNSMALQQKLAERQKLMSQLDQAKMQEQLNRAMSSLNQTVDQNAPSLEQVRAKIEARYAKALGTSELSGQTVEARMLEVQQAAIGTEARSRLDTMRAELGLPSAAGAALGAGATAQLGTGASPLSDPTPAAAPTEAAADQTDRQG
jgi:phage shock protein A